MLFAPFLYVDETYVRVGKNWAYLYRTVDESDQVVDVLLREKHDLESAKAFFKQAIKRRGVVPDEVITDKHRGYLRAVKQHTPHAKHRRTGLHRKRALTTKPIERSHVPTKDWTRSMRGSGATETGQRLLEGTYWLKQCGVATSVHPTEVIQVRSMNTRGWKW